MKLYELTVITNKSTGNNFFYKFIGRFLNQKHCIQKRFINKSSGLYPIFTSNSILKNNIKGKFFTLYIMIDPKSSILKDIQNEMKKEPYILKYMLIKK
jgi:hypothetical protein